MPNLRHRKSAVGNAHRLSWFALLAVGSFYIIELNLPRIGENRPAYLIFIALSLVLAPNAYRQHRYANKNEYPFLVIISLLLYILLCIISLFWYSDKYYLMFHVSTILICAFVALSAVRVSRFDAYLSLLYVGVALMALSWIALVVIPEVALQQKGIWRLKGVMGHEMRLASVAGITFLSALYLIRYHKNIFSSYVALNLSIILILSLITILSTQSRTILAYIVICSYFILFFGSRWLSRFSILYIILFLVLAAFLIGFDAFLALFSRGDADLTLTGRTVIWERTVLLAAQRPWTGYGFTSFGSEAFDYLWPYYRPAVAHNVWLEAYFELGIPGALALLLVHIALLRAAWKVRLAPDQPPLAFYLIIFAALCGLTGSGLGGRLQTIVGVCIFVLASEHGHFVRSRGEVSRRRRSVSVRHSPLRAAPQSRFGNLSR